MTTTHQMIQALEDMVSRRIDNTGETRAEAIAHITKFLKDRYEPVKSKA